MARARNIKPSFFEDDIMGGLEPIARLLSIGLWTIADFRGNLDFRPAWIKTKCLPYDNCDTEALLIKLERSGFITTYSVDGKKYIHINSFHKDQNPHPNEKKSGTDIPDISESAREINELAQDVKNREQDGTDHADSLILIPDSPSLIPDPLNAQGATPAVAAEVVVAEPKKSDRRKEHRASHDVKEVFEYWQQAMGHTRAQLDDKRSKAIGARLADGYCVADLCRAIDGCKLTPFNMGDNDRKEVFDDVELICRNGPNVDRFMKNAKRAPGVVPTGTTNQQKTMAAVQRYLEKHGHVA